MKIACLGWGSLLWKSGPLVLASSWHDDGPLLPIEFARVGDGGELSTALCGGAAPQRVWWAELATDDVDEAREQLRRREQIDLQHPEWVGSYRAGTDAADPLGIAGWLAERRMDALVWTALLPRIGGVEGRCPGPDEAVAYLDSLTGETKAHAEDYLRRVPASMDTENRRALQRRRAAAG